MSQYMKAGYTPPKPPKKKKIPPKQKPQTHAPQQATSPQRRPPQTPKKPKVKRPLGVRMVMVLAALLGACTLAVLAFVIVAYQELNAYADQYYPGVYVETVHLGGLTSEQATTALKSKMDARIEAYLLDIVNENGQKIKSFSASDVSLAYDLQGQLNEALKVGREGNLIERLLTVKSVREQPQVFEWAIRYDAQLLADYVRSLAEQIDCEVVNAQSIFNPSSAQPFAFTEEQTGAQLNQEDLIACLQERLNTLSTQPVVMQITTSEPERTRAMLEQNVSLRARVLSEVDKSSTDNRNTNIRLAVEKINGSVIEPGESFDFNAIVGKRTASDGYLEAEEIAYGEGVSGVGGGVCQVSTAIYQAALCAGMEVTEQHPFVFPAAYAPAGQDATVSDQGLNLTFRNQTDYPLYIKTRFYEMDDGAAQIEVTFFGAPLDAVYTLESNITQELEIPEPIRVRDKEQTYVTYMDEEMQVSEGRAGCVAQTYRVAWVAGEETGREMVATSTYQPVAPQIYVGTLLRGSEGE